MNRARGSTCSRSPGTQKKRHSSSKPSGAPSSCSVTLGRAARGRKLVNAPSAFSTASLSILPRRAASTIGSGSVGARSSLKPVDVRSPENAALRNSSVCEILVSGRSNGIWFQPSTMRSDEAPMPSTNLPLLASDRAAASCASSAGPRVKTPTTPVPSRTRSVQAADSASGVKPSDPFVSPLHMSV